MLQGKEHLRREGWRTSLRFSLADISDFAAAGSSSHGSRIKIAGKESGQTKYTFWPGPGNRAGESKVAITAFGMSKRAGGGWLAGLPLSLPSRWQTSRIMRSEGLRVDVVLLLLFLPFPSRSGSSARDHRRRAEDRWFAQERAFLSDMASEDGHAMRRENAQSPPSSSYRTLTTACPLSTPDCRASQEPNGQVTRLVPRAQLRFTLVSSVFGRAAAQPSSNIRSLTANAKERVLLPGHLHKIPPALRNPKPPTRSILAPFSTPPGPRKPARHEYSQSKKK